MCVCVCVCVCVSVCVYLILDRQGKLIRKSLVVGGLLSAPLRATTMASLQASLDTVPADSLKLD